MANPDLQWTVAIATMSCGLGDSAERAGWVINGWGLALSDELRNGQRGERRAWRTFARPESVWSGVSSWAWLLPAAVLAFVVGCGVGERGHSMPANAVADSSRSGVDESVGGSPERPIEVVTTVGMVADIVRNVGGDRVRVTQLMGSGVDPHLYRVTRDDVRSIFAADVIFSSGLMLEGNLSDALNRLSRRKPVAAIGEWAWYESPWSREDAADESASEELDPHVWMDVDLWSQGAARVAEVLAEVAPRHRDEFRENAVRYREELLSLHRWGVETLASIPPSRRLLVTSHEAFGHFARAYGLQAMGVQGLATDSEAGLTRINRLVDQIIERDIGAVFVESSVPRKSMDAVIEGAGSRGHAVRIAGELYSDACGPDGTYEGTYAGMMDHNITLIAQALGGSVSPQGYRDRPAGDRGRLEQNEPGRAAQREGEF